MEAVKNLFTVTTMDKEIEEEFYNFFVKWDLLNLTTNAHKTGVIKVTDSDARAVINFGGAYNKDLKEFSEVMDYAQDNKSHEQAIFKVIYGVKSFQKLMNNIRKINRFVKNEIDSEHQYNRWNIVFYNKKLI